MYFVSETAQVGLKSGRVEAPADDAAVVIEARHAEAAYAAVAAPRRPPDVTCGAISERLRVGGVLQLGTGKHCLPRHRHAFLPLYSLVT